MFEEGWVDYDYDCDEHHDYDSDYYDDENDEDPYDMENYKPAQK